MSRVRGGLKQNKTKDVEKKSENGKEIVRNWKLSKVRNEGEKRKLTKEGGGSHASFVCVWCLYLWCECLV